MLAMMIVRWCLQRVHCLFGVTREEQCPGGGCKKYAVFETLVRFNLMPGKWAYNDVSA